MRRHRTVLRRVFVPSQLCFGSTQLSPPPAVSSRDLDHQSMQAPLLPLDSENKVPGPGLGVLFVHVGYVTGKLPHYGAHLAQFECAVRRGRHLGVAEGRKATTNPNVPGLRLVGTHPLLLRGERRVAARALSPCPTSKYRSSLPMYLFTYRHAHTRNHLQNGACVAKSGFPNLRVNFDARPGDFRSAERCATRCRS